MSVHDEIIRARAEAMARQIGKMLWELEMSQAMINPDGTDLMQDIVRDNRVPVVRQGAGSNGGAKVGVGGAPLVRDCPTGPVDGDGGTAARGYGWANSQPLSVPPGTDFIDKMLPAKKGGV